MAKIVVITDMDEMGSGYKNICIPLLTGLAYVVLFRLWSASAIS